MPVGMGFSMPAEWEPQRAIWLSWPVRAQTWPGHYELIPVKFAEIVATISRFQEVHVNVAAALQPLARRLIGDAGADFKRVVLHAHPPDDPGGRDPGPICVRPATTRDVAITDWDFNAWGGKFSPCNNDNAIPSRVASALAMRRFLPGMILEGGSIDVNGQGLLLTTEICLLNPNRNPQLSRDQIEQRLRDYLGVTHIYWLGKGIEGDDTDGHVDDLSRFVSPECIVTAVEKNESDVNFRALRENLERLQGMRTPAGRAFKIIELPMPDPCVTDGQRLPASYANFLILNDAVLVPVFRQPARDAAAIEILGGCFPGRQLVPIDCRDWGIGRGTMLCISPLQPA